MELTEFIAAIDLGSSKILGAIGTVDVTGSITVHAIEQEETGSCIKRGCIQNVEETATKVKNIIARLNNKTKSEISKIYVGLGGQSVYSINYRETLSFDEETQITSGIINQLKERCRQVVIPGKEVLEVVPFNYVIDGKKVEQPVGVYGAQIEANVKLIVGRPNILKNLRRLEEKLEIPFADILFSPAAAANVLSEAEKRLGCALVDFGAATTTVSVYKDAVLHHLAVIPIGGDSITKDITSLRLLENVAENIKHNVGDANPVSQTDDKRMIKPAGAANLDMPEIQLKTVQNVILARAEEIIDNVLNQVRIAGFEEQPASGYIITGGGAGLKGLDELIRSKTEVDVKKGSLQVSIISKSGKEHQNDTSLSVLLGLLLMGNINCCKEKVNVITAQNEPEVQPVHTTKTGKGNSVGGFFGGIFDKIKHLDGGNDNVEYDT